MSKQRELTPGQIKQMSLNSQARSEARRTPWDSKKVAAATAAGSALVATTVALAFGMRGNNNTAPSGVPESGSDNVPAATMEYLESRPTQTVTIEAGEGVRDAVYGVDPQTVGASTDIEAGVTEVVEGQVGHTASGTPMPQAGEQVQVPDLPGSIEQVPPAAR